MTARLYTIWIGGSLRVIHLLNQNFTENTIKLFYYSCTVYEVFTSLALLTDSQMKVKYLVFQTTGINM